MSLLERANASLKLAAASPPLVDRVDQPDVLPGCSPDEAASLYRIVCI
jgi:hypothetical protein